MGLILTIDTGTHSAWTLSEHGRIKDCGLVLVKHDRPLQPLPEVTGALVYIERPVYRPNEQVDPNNIITLGIKVGRFKETYLVLGNKVIEITPVDWKGSTPKDIQNARDAQALSPEETVIVQRALSRVAASHHHDIWDSVGINVWACRKVRLRK